MDTSVDCERKALPVAGFFTPSWVTPKPDRSFYRYIPVTQRALNPQPRAPAPLLDAAGTLQFHYPTCLQVQAQQKRGARETQV